MKRIIFFVVAFGLFFINTGCRKNTYEAPEVDFKEVHYDNTFDWNTARVIDMEIHSDQNVLINISSVDKQTRYHRGMHNGNNKVYRVTLSLPKTVTQLMVNQLTVEVKEGVNMVSL